MGLLQNLTVAYGILLAVTVVGGLVVVAVYLRRISIALADARAAMDEMVEESGPLAGHLERLRDRSGEWAAQLGVARAPLARVEHSVATSTDGRGGPVPLPGSTGRVRAPRRWKWASRLFGR